MPVYKRDVSSISKSGSAKLKGDVTLSAGSNMTLTQSGQNIEVSTTGGGDVVGPASSTDNEIPRYNSTTGKLIQGSSVKIGDIDTNVITMEALPQSAADTDGYGFGILAGEGNGTGGSGLVFLSSRDGETGVTIDEPNGSLELNALTNLVVNSSGTATINAETALYLESETEGVYIISTEGTGGNSGLLSMESLTADRVFTFPDATTTLVGHDTTQTLTNKTLTSPKINENVAVTATATELNYTDGVTSNIQTQLDGKQPLDSDLTAVAGLSSTGLIARTGAGTAAARTITGTANQVVVADGDGVAGNPTLSLPQSIGTGSTVQFAGIELSHASQNTLTASSGILSIEGVAIPTISSADTLSNKTLTAPKFADLGFIADANGNELIIMDTVTSAVNELTISNAATGNPPIIAATGGDTNIPIRISGKGTGAVQLFVNGVNQLGAWQAWTPTLSGLFTDAKWNKDCKYIQIGKTVHFYFNVVANTTTPMAGAGEPTFTLPVTSVAVSGNAPLFHCRILDSGTAAYIGTSEHASTTTAIARLIGTGSTYAAPGVATASVPFTWTTNDQITITGTYEAA